MAAREVVLDSKGQIVREPRDPKAKRRRKPAPDAAAAQAAELKPGQTRKEIEGVCVFKNNE